MLRVFFILIGLILLIALLSWWLIPRSDDDLLPSPDVPAEGSISITGEVVCLPHRDTTGPQTMECAYGLLGSDGNYYGLRDQTSPGSVNSITSIPTGTTVVVQGQFSSDNDTRYATVGVIDIATITPSGDANLPDTEEDTYSDGVITFAVPEEFGLAISDEQILVNSTIPPCESGFDYCVYYNGTAYTDTNFSSAGLAISKRPDLNDVDACLSTQPEGYSTLEVATTSADGQSTSAFEPLQDAAAGSYANGAEYRLYASSTCYQFTTIVGETQFANMATGTEFTTSERESMLDTLRGIVESITLFSSAQRIVLPSITSS